jgi:hypothetical protein
MRGYPIIFGEGVDPDAYQYFLRAGIDSGTQTPSSYDNAASFNGTNQFLSRASNSTLTVTGTSFTFAFWANTPNTSNGMVISKSDGNNAREFQIVLNTGRSLGFTVFPDGTFANRKDLNSGASTFIANTWNLFVCRYDSSGGGTMGISINGQAFNSLGSVGAITQTNTNTLTLGCFVNTASGLNYNGGLSSVGFWKKALTASEVTQLWNSGAGRTYASLDTGLRNNLVSWWALNQNSVTADSHGTNTLTNNGSVTAPNLGPIVTTTQNSRQLINNFVKGIKSLGLWNSMACWPLRASQNAGSGTTAFSLGGLGQFNGTLVNAPTWGSNGMLFATSGTNWMSFPERTLSYPFCYSAAVINGAIADASPMLSKNAPLGLAISLNRLELVMAINSVAITLNTTYAPWNTPNQAVLMNSRVTGNTSMFVSANGGSETAQTPTSQRYDLAPVDRLSGNRGLETTRIAFALLTSGASVPNAALYALYRQTLGLGLNLPSPGEPLELQLYKTQATCLGCG